MDDELLGARLRGRDGVSKGHISKPSNQQASIQLEAERLFLTWGLDSVFFPVSVHLALAAGYRFQSLHVAGYPGCWQQQSWGSKKRS